MNKKALFLYIWAVFISVSGCVKEHFNQDRLSKTIVDETTVAVPIGYVKNSLKEIFSAQIDSGILVEDQTGLLWFKFKQNTYSLKVSDIVKYPVFDTAYAIINNTGLPIDLNAADAAVTLNQSFNFNFGYSQGKNGEQIDSLLLNNMNMKIDVLGAGTINANLLAAFPGISYNNLSYSKNLIVSSSNNYADLNAYTVHLQHTATAKNQLQVNFELKMQQTNRIIAPGEKILDVNLQFSAIDFEILYGYIGQISITPPALPLSIINLSNPQLSGYFNFDNANINLTTKNSFGVPFSFKIGNYTFSTYYKPTNKIVFQNIIITSDPAKIAFPTMSQIGQTIDGTSSIGTGPIILGFENYYSTVSGSIAGTTNPEGQKDYNFVKKNSQLDITTDFNTPFWGNTSNLTMTDKINFGLVNFFSANYANIERLLFVLNFTNALPLDAKMQVYFCDVSGAKLDSMFKSPYLIKGSSNADGNGKVGAQPNDPVKVPFEGARLQTIEATSFLLVQSQVKTIDADKNPPVSWKFFSDYYFYSHIGVAATIKK